MNIDLSIEKNLIGHILYYAKTKDNDSVFSIIDKVEEHWFTDEKNRIIYNSIFGIFSKRMKIDSIALIKHLHDTGNLELSGGADYISKLLSDRSRTTDLQYLIDTFTDIGRKKELLRIFTEGVASINKDALSSSEELIGTVEKEISLLRGYERRTTVDLIEDANKVIDKANKVEEFGCYGYSWGIRPIDILTGGIELGKSYVVGATKKSGKTKFVINTIHALKSNNVPVLFLSLEMNGEAVVKELLSRFADVNNNEMKKRLSPLTEMNLRATIKVIAEGIEVDTQTGLNVMQVRHKITSAARSGVKVVFLDYLQRMDFQIRGSSMNYASIIANTVSQLADIAKENNVAFIFLSQLRNDAENQNADISFLKDSGGIAEGVDCILIINNQDRILKNYTNKTNEIWINIEQRSGQSGVAKCYVDLGTATYTELSEESKSKFKQGAKGVERAF